MIPADRQFNSYFDSANLTSAFSTSGKSEETAGPASLQPGPVATPVFTESGILMFSERSL